MKNFSTILLLSLIAIVGVFTLDVYLPGIPAMAKEFGVSLTQISYTFTVFTVVFAISQIFHGTLSDYLGRKPILLSGLAIAGIATIFCIIAKSYESLLLARILQAIGIAVFVVVNAIIRDLYIGNKAVQVRTFVITMSGVAISIAPTVGGLLQNHFGWQGGFIASLALIVLTFFYVILFFTESNSKRSQEKFNINSFLKSYISLFSNHYYALYVIQATLAYTVHFTFIILSAKIFMEVLGFSPLTFGYLMFIYGGIYFISGLVTAFIAKKFSIHTLTKLGGMCIASGGTLMLLLSLLMPLNTWQVLLPMAFMTIGITAVRVAASTGALAPIPKQAGQGAAGLNLVQFMLTAVIATCMSTIKNQPEISIALLAIICAFSIVYISNRLNWMNISDTPILVESK
jgi:DHA1 family bicyclomycin/chloramphenicol resistance-like MFS transporter